MASLRLALTKEKWLNRRQAIAKRWRRRLWREYFELTITDGLLVIVYLDLLEGKWYLQRVYD